MCKNFIKGIAWERKLGWICERLGSVVTQQCKSGPREGENKDNYYKCCSPPRILMKIWLGSQGECKTDQPSQKTRFFQVWDYLLLTTCYAKILASRSCRKHGLGAFLPKGKLIVINHNYFCN